MLNRKSKKIVILGGGTAGWMAANLLHLHLSQHGFDTSLVESPQIGIIGVGEGSTPQLRQFFNQLGLSESQWMPRCNATYKNGISFVNWSDKSGYKTYFHPFPSLPDRHTGGGFLINSLLKRQGFEVHAHPDAFFLSAQLAKHHQSPKTHDKFPVNVSYGYHFDSALLGEFLKEFAVSKGVTHKQAKITSVSLHPSGDISHLISDSGESISGDIFIDCSGFAGELIQQALGVEFISFASNLFNDAAVAIPSVESGPLRSQTIATAMNSGWSWNIPLTNRTGNGYVYSSAYLSADQAESELRDKLGLVNADVPVKHLKMKVGRVARHWHKNCLAVGLSQGFIEPLEATALHLVQDTIENFVSAFIAGQFSNQHQQEYNQRINARFEGIRDYIVCHYKVNSRHDSCYWLDNRNNPLISDSLRLILDCWSRGGDLVKEIERQNIGAFYPAISWHCLLAGYGHFPQHSAPTSPTHTVDLAEIKDYIDKCQSGFKSHATALSELYHQAHSKDKQALE